MITKINNIWSVETGNVQDSNYYCAILKFMFSIMYDVYGNIRNHGEPCVIKNEATMDSPILLYTKPAKLLLCQESTSYWAQTIFQLSHELTHYYIRQHKSDMYVSVEWFEETICEATSLVGLNFAAKRWGECTLSKINPSFGSSIDQYLQSELSKPESSALICCKDLRMLKSINETCTKNRETRTKERNYLYREMFEAPKDFRIVKDYTRFINDDMLTLDFDTWRGSCQSRAIQILKSIQPAF